jgi:hypothetical protein
MAGRISAQYVPSRWMVLNSMNCGRTKASVGSMSPARITANATDLPRKRRRARPKPIVEHTTRVRITDSVEIAVERV